MPLNNVVKKYIHIHTHTYTQTDIQTHRHIHTHTQTHAYTHTHRYTHIHIYTHIHTKSYTHTCTDTGVKMVDSKRNEVERALENLVSVTELNGNLKKELKKQVLEAVSILRNQFFEMRQQKGKRG